MENLRPHHVVCLTRLYPALSLFTKNENLYYESIKEELIKSTNLRSNLLDYCKVTWGTIYSYEVMKVLTKVVNDGVFRTSGSFCDSICFACDGNVNKKCIAEDKIQIMDKISTNILNLKTNILTNVSLTDRIEFDEVCSLCGTRDKCNLIRRAVKNH